MCNSLSQPFSMCIPVDVYALVIYANFYWHMGTCTLAHMQIFTSSCVHSGDQSSFGVFLHFVARSFESENKRTDGQMKEKLWGWCVVETRVVEWVTSLTQVRIEPGTGRDLETEAAHRDRLVPNLILGKGKVHTNSFGYCERVNVSGQVARF